MWNNIGRKLQSLAKGICWIGIIGSIIWGIAIMTQSNRYQSTIGTGIVYIILGCLGSWIGSWAMYGLGLVVDYVENCGTFLQSNSDSYYDSANNSAYENAPQNEKEEQEKNAEMDKQREEEARPFSADSFLSEIECEDSVAGIMEVWKKYKLNIQYPTVEAYLNRYKEQEETEGKLDNISGIKKIIRELLGK